MPVFKFVISDKSKSYQIEKDHKDSPVMGKKIGDTLQGDFLGLGDYELQITGGSDKDGFPMRKDIEGVMRRRIIITEGVGLRTRIEGLRRRRMLRGNTIAADIVQINCKVLKAGDKSIEELLGIKKEEVKEVDEVKEKLEAKEAEKEKELPIPDSKEEKEMTVSDTKEEKTETKITAETAAAQEST